MTTDNNKPWVAVKMSKKRFKELVDICVDNLRHDNALSELDICDAQDRIDSSLELAMTETERLKYEETPTSPLNKIVFSDLADAIGGCIKVSITITSALEGK